MTEPPETTSATDAALPDDATASPRDRYYRGTINRVYYGSESGTLTSAATGREYQFRHPFVQIVGPIPRIDGLREGMTVGFDLSWTSRGVRVSMIRVFD
jgi:hypothetical protein